MSWALFELDNLSSPPRGRCLLSLNAIECTSPADLVLSASLLVLDPVLRLRSSLCALKSLDADGHTLKIIPNWRRPSVPFDPTCTVSLHPRLFNFLANKPGIANKLRLKELVQLIAHVPSTRHEVRLGDGEAAHILSEARTKAVHSRRMDRWVREYSFEEPVRAAVECLEALVEEEKEKEKEKKRSSQLPLGKHKRFKG